MMVYVTVSRELTSQKSSRLAALSCHNASEVTNYGQSFTALVKTRSMAAADIGSFSIKSSKDEACSEVANGKASVYISIVEAFEL